MKRKIPCRGVEPNSWTIVSVISRSPEGSITMFTSNRGVDSNTNPCARAGIGSEHGPDQDAEPCDAGGSPHRASTKKNEMAMMTYAPVSCAPSSQLLRPSLEIMKTKIVESATAATSNVLKTKSIG